MREHLEADSRAIGNVMQVFIEGGTSTENGMVDYLAGRRRWRAEAVPLLQEKLGRYLHGQISPKNSSCVLEICADQASSEACAVAEMMSLMRIWSPFFTRSA